MTSTCLQCNDDFHKEAKELFCGHECRIKFWKSKSRKGSTDEHLEDLKYTMEKTRAQAKILRKHMDRVENDYSDWEDRIVAIESRIYDMEEEVGIEEKEITTIKNQRAVNIDALDELIGDMS